jgi:chromosome partitioning protein
MASVTVVLNQKGGIGKSTITVNLSATIAEVSGDADGAASVAAVSVDPQGSTVWWSERVGEGLPFRFVDAYDDLEGIKRLRDVTAVKHAVIDTPGWMVPEARKPGADPLGTGPISDAIRASLDAADFVIVPIEPEPMGFEPTQNTIERIVKPRGIPYVVVISNWDPRDGTVDLEETKAFVRNQGWPLARTVIRHYKLHSRAAADRMVVTRYPKSRVAQEAQKDFLNLALEHQILLANSRSGGKL